MHWSNRIIIQLVLGFGVFLLGAGFLPVKVSMASSANFNAFQLPAVAKDHPLDRYIYYWEDTSKKANLEDARRSLFSGQFVPSFGNLNKGFTQSAYWFYVAINNTTDIKRDLLLENDYPMLDRLDVYCSVDDSQQYFLLGDHTSRSARPLDLRNFVLPLTLPPHQLASCFFRVESSSNVVLPLSVSDVHSYVEVVHDVQWLLGSFYGIAVGLFFFSAVIYFALRELMYFYYALHCVGGILFNSGLDGTATEFWYALGMQDSGVLVSVCLSQLGALFFALAFLKIRSSHYKVYQFSMAVAGLLVLYIIAVPFVNTRIMTQLVVTSGFVFLIYMLFVGLLRVKDRYVLAWIFLGGWGPILVAAMLVVLTVLGVLQDSAISIYSMKLAWCIELVVLSIGMGWNIRTMKLQKQTTESQMLEARRESIDKTQFLAKVSHEVRGPMSGILGLSELLATTQLSPEQSRYVKAIYNGSKALMEVTNDFLDYSKIEAGKMSLNVSAFNLRELIQDCAAIYEMAARKKGLKLVCIFEVGTPLMVKGDERRVRQVLLNLISNALKYTEVGYIKIRISLTDQILDQQIVLKITVEDTGVGIEQKNLDQLFQNYSQLNQPVMREDPSTGLGLVICRQLVELMGGEIHLNSEPGKGSEFWFTLPVSIQDDYDYLDHEEIYNLIAPIESDVEIPIEYSGQEDTSPPVYPTRKTSEPTLAASDFQYIDEEHHLSIDLRILVVEDNDINLKVIHGFLDKLGLKPVTLHNGLEAVQNITEGGGEYDLILMDCEMPLMDGYTAAQKIHAWQAENQLSKTPIIALSAHATDMHKQKAEEAGMALHISKPLTFDKFINAIDVVMGQ